MFAFKQLVRYHGWQKYVLRKREMERKYKRNTQFTMVLGQIPLPCLLTLQILAIPSSHSTVPWVTRTVWAFFLDFVLFILELFGFCGGFLGSIYGRKTTLGPVISKFLHTLDICFTNFPKCLLIWAQEPLGFSFTHKEVQGFWKGMFPVLKLSAVQSFCMALGLEPFGVQKSEFNYINLLHENLYKLHLKIWQVQYCVGSSIH
jgi:hypothetical protein